MALGQDLWLALMIGNTRWHWGAFRGPVQSPEPPGSAWLGGWHTAPLSHAAVRSLVHYRFSATAWQRLDLAMEIPDLGGDQPPLASEFDREFDPAPELWLASVVQQPIAWLADYSALRPITLGQVPLAQIYPTLGVDRALALVGAGAVYGWPVLVIDCGTALTFTAGVGGALLGGAILPGLRSQFRALATDTDGLRQVSDLSPALPPWWAQDTATAIASGIVHTQLAGIRDRIGAWQTEYLGSTVAITGGDSEMVWQWLQHQTPALAQQVRLDPDLGFWGIEVCRRWAGGEVGPAHPSATDEGR
jgi:type III pantothenate kinase